MKKIIVATLLSLGMLSSAHAATTNANLRKQARAVAKKYMAKHYIGRAPSVRVEIDRAAGKVRAGIYGRLIAKGVNGPIILGRRQLYKTTFSIKNGNLAKGNRWTALPRPMF